MARSSTILFLLYCSVFLVSAHNAPQETFPLSGLCRQDNTYLFTAPRTDSDYELAGYLTPVTVEDQISSKGMEWYLVKYKENLYYTFTNCVETDKKNFLLLSNFQAVIQDKVFLIRSLNTGLVFYKEPIRLPIQYMELYSDLKVVQKIGRDYLEVSVGGVDVTGFIYGLYDIRNRKWRLRFDNKANQNVMSYSQDGKYAAVDSGTSASVRNLDIFNLSNGKREFSSEYAASLRPYWSSNRFYFYQYAGNFVKGLPPLDKSSQQQYAQKFSFFQGCLERLNEYTNIYLE